MEARPKTRVLRRSITKSGLLALLLGCSVAPEVMGQSLEQRIAQGPSETYWLSYEIDTDPELGFVCCPDRTSTNRKIGLMRPGTCRPDADNESWSTWDGDTLAGSERMRVLLRVAGDKVDRVRAYSPACSLEFQNRVETIQVKTEDSLRFLRELVNQPQEEHGIEMIHATLGRHLGSTADRIMAELAADVSSSSDDRRSAIFWLGQTRGAFAVETLRNLLDKERDRELLEHMIFSLSQTRTPDNQGTMELIRLVQRTDDPDIRRHALFWLGDSKDPRALDLLADLLS